jgi:rhomboid protease GluP
MNGSQPPEPPKYRHPLEQSPEERRAIARANAPAGRVVQVNISGGTQTPYLTYLLLVVNAVIFLLRYLNAETGIQVLLAGHIDAHSILVEGEWYRLLTGMFLHFDEAHILNNGLSLLILGSNLETIFGRRRFLIIYLLGGLLGSVLHILLSSDVPAVGASGAIFALVGAEIVFLRMNRHLMAGRLTQRYQQLLILAAINLSAGFLTTGIAVWGHVGGFVGGALLAWFSAPRYFVNLTDVPPDAAVVTGVDTNPLAKRIVPVAAYCAGLLLLLVLAAFILRP